MKKTFFLLATTLFLFIQSALGQDILDSFPKPSTSVNDFENIFTDDEEIVLMGLLIAYNKRADAKIHIVTINEKSSTVNEFDDLTLQIANKWEIGSGDKYNGILIGISCGLRRIRIQNGIDIEERMTNDETNEIITTFFIPKFQEGEYFKGTRDGLKAIVNHLEKIK